MSGSTFISTETPKELVKLKEDPDSLDDFVHVSLNRLLTLDFEMALDGAKVNWVHVDPIVYDEASGIAIFQINPTALRKALNSPSALELEHPEDIALLREFVAENGADHIYELATF